MSAWSTSLTLTVIGVVGVITLEASRNPPPLVDAASLIVSAEVGTNAGSPLGAGACRAVVGETCTVEVAGEDGGGFIARLRPVVQGDEFAMDVNLVVREPSLSECDGTDGGCGATLKALIATKRTFGPMGWARAATASGPYHVEIVTHGLPASVVQFRVDAPGHPDRG